MYACELVIQFLKAFSDENNLQDTILWFSYFYFHGWHLCVVCSISMFCFIHVLLNHGIILVLAWFNREMSVRIWLMICIFACLSRLIFQETKQHNKCWCNHDCLSKQVSFDSLNWEWTAYVPEWCFTVWFYSTEIELCIGKKLVALFWPWTGLYISNKPCKNRFVK